ncbi:unnamed protein product [Tetraodon nigroviridis]|uniref:(spotted green pufferfish) hypothetical protein n=1 Tax=Tetraodon nigroviridis TaxID=99883 RepID=Q4RRY9_TETNG|nr:unnamed protein product [Tetraodon nigroviridis]
MSYSCTNRGNSQDPSSAKDAAGDNPGRDTGGTDASPKQTAAMKVKKGCNSAEVGVPVTTEEDLLSSAVITPEDVLGLQKITESKFTSSCRPVRVRGGQRSGKRLGCSLAIICAFRPVSRTRGCVTGAPVANRSGVEPFGNPLRARGEVWLLEV